MNNSQNVNFAEVIGENEVRFVKHPKRSKLKNNKPNAFAWVLTAILVLYSALLLMMFFWCVITSFKDTFDYIMNPFGLPQKWMWSNYSQLFNTIKIQAPSTRRWVYMDEMFLNSIVYSLGCTFVATMMPCIVAYLTAKYKFRLNKIIHTTVIVTMILPIVGSLPSELQIVKTLGLYDHMWGMFILKANFLGMYFLVFYAVFKNLSWEYAEAAFVDGAGHFTIMVKIMIPLIKSTIFAVAIMVFIGFWNDYQTPMLYIPSSPTVAYGLFQFSNLGEEGASSVSIVMAGSILVMIPMLVLFVIFKDKFIGNLTVGGIKG